MRKKFLLLNSKDIILDTNTIFDLKELSRLDLPKSLFKNVYFSQNIFNEELDVETQELILQEGYKPLSLETNEGYTMLFKLKENFRALSICDKVVIAIAYEKSLLCCTNDKAARIACEKVKVEPVGTLGILCGCYENKIISFDSLTKLFDEYILNSSARLGEEIITTIRDLYSISSISDNVINI